MGRARLAPQCTPRLGRLGAAAPSRRVVVLTPLEERIAEIVNGLPEAPVARRLGELAPVSMMWALKVSRVMIGMRGSSANDFALKD